LVSTLLLEGDEKLSNAENALKNGSFADSIYYSYSTLLNGAKALLVGKDVITNSQKTIIELFDEHFIETKEIGLIGTFKELALRIKNNEPKQGFAESYYEEAKTFTLAVALHRKKTSTS
jgi:sulfite reductase (ferredoxin)